MQVDVEPIIDEWRRMGDQKTRWSSQEIDVKKAIACYVEGRTLLACADELEHQAKKRLLLLNGYGE